jgi:hypothetical protein
LAKWAKREDDLELRGIIAQNYEWLEHVRHWFYTHGGNLSNDDNLEFIHNIKDIRENLVYVVVKTSKGGFVPDREDDELTLALTKPEHLGRTRGYGSMPWKFGFCEWHSQQ